MSPQAGTGPDTSDSSLKKRIASFNNEAANLNKPGELENSYSRLMEWTYKLTEKKVPYLLNGEDFAKDFTSRDRDVDEENSAEATSYFIKQLQSTGMDEKAAEAHAKTVGVLAQNMVSIAMYGIGNTNDGIAFMSNHNEINLETKGNNLEITVTTKGTVMDTRSSTCFDKDGNTCEFEMRKDAPQIERQVVFTATFDESSRSSTLAYKSQEANCDIEAIKKKPLETRAQQELRSLLKEAKTTRDASPEKRFGMVEAAIKTHSDEYGLASTWSAVKAGKGTLNKHTQAAKIHQAFGRPTASWKTVMKAMEKCASSAKGAKQPDSSVITEIMREARQAGVRPLQEIVIKKGANVPGKAPSTGQTESTTPKPKGA